MVCLRKHEWIEAESEGRAYEHAFGSRLQT